MTDIIKENPCFKKSLNTLFSIDCCPILKVLKIGLLFHSIIAYNSVVKLSMSVGLYATVYQPAEHIPSTFYTIKQKGLLTWSCIVCVVG